jgi:hypothetical protein
VKGKEHIMKNSTKITTKEIEEYRQYEQANTEIKNTYRSLIVAVLNAHKVRSIKAVGDNARVTENFFDTIEVNEDGTLMVDRHGLKLDNLYFDFTCDFARCLSYIEDEIFIQERNGNSKHGYKVTFRK